MWVGKVRSVTQKKDKLKVRRERQQHKLNKREVKECVFDLCINSAYISWVGKMRIVAQKKKIHKRKTITQMKTKRELKYSVVWLGDW